MQPFVVLFELMSADEANDEDWVVVVAVVTFVDTFEVDTIVIAVVVVVAAGAVATLFNAFVCS